MQVTQYPEVNELLHLLLLKIKFILGKKLVGLYLGGSLVIGDFDIKISDIDLIAALAGDLDNKEFESLQKMHTDFATEYKAWDDRIEVCYITVNALKNVKSQTSQIANISPGEPFHRKESNREWLMNWYLIREKSKTLFGPDPKTIIELISKEEFIQAVKVHVKSWRKYINNMNNRYAQGYAILTMCRNLYLCKNGKQISKKQGALWAQKELPQWSLLIQNALKWREDGKNKEVIDETTFQETKRFVNFAIKLIVK